MKKGVSFNEQYDLYITQYSKEHIVLKYNNQTLCKGEFEERITYLIAKLIDLGVRKGDGIGYTMDNSMDIIPLFIAISKIGAHAVPLFHLMPPRTQVKNYKDTKVKFVITTSNQLQGLIEASKEMEALYTLSTIDSNDKGVYSFAEPLYKHINIHDFILKETPLDLSLMVGFSSGTTGTAKFVYMSQGNIGEEINVSKKMNHSKVDGRRLYDTSCIAFPVSTSIIPLLIGIIFDGTTLIYSNDMTPINFLKLIESESPEQLVGPPAYYEMLLQHPDIDRYNLESVKCVGMGMDFCSLSLIKRLKEKLPHLSNYVNGYGLVETCNVYMCNNIDLTGETFEDLHYLEVPEGTDIIIEVRNEENKVVELGEVGQIFVKGSIVVKGYANKQEETEVSFKDGWLKTGDIARRESDKAVTLLGRAKNFIKRGGKSISPIIVENAINQVKGIVQTGVVGIPHPLYGEMIWAFVVADQSVTLKAIKKHCREVLPYYMIPDQIEFVEAIPKNPGVGKVNYRALKTLGSQRLEEMLGGNKNE